VGADKGDVGVCVYVGELGGEVGDDGAADASVAHGDVWEWVVGIEWGRMDGTYRR